MKNKFRFLPRMLLAVLSIVLVIFTFLFLTRRSIHLFDIRTVLVSGDAVQVVVSGNLKNRNLLFFSGKEEAKKIQDENSLVKSIEIRKRFPSTLEIIVTKRTPAVQIFSGNETFSVDETGVVLGFDKNSSLPVLIFDISPVRIVKKIEDERIIQSLLFIEGSRSFIEISSVTSSANRSLRARFEQTDIFFTQSGDRQKALSTLQTVVSGFRIKGVMPKVIDLRFEKPVIQM